MFRNEAEGRFRQVTDDVGDDLKTPAVARGSAFGDIDNDGDLDLVLTTSGGPARLFRNNGGSKNHWIGFRLRGVDSNPEAVVVGLGTATSIDQVDIEWPSGTKSTPRSTGSNVSWNVSGVG